jgi:hypothetical protein|tara:strand:+ start:536 stop:808 length:273 start_codon:yes stop_codon:yes gene_type:complete
MEIKVKKGNVTHINIPHIINNKQVMRNRSLITKKLEQLDTTLTTLQQIVNRQEPIQVYKSNIIKAKDLLEDLQSMIEMEPMSTGETKFKQ